MANLKMKKLTEDELLSRINESLKGKFYTSEEMHRLAKIAKENKCKISELPDEIKEKVFSECQNKKSDDKI